MKSKSVTGEVYGNLTIIGDAYYKPSTARKVAVQCTCGNIKDVFLTSLRCGDTSSCGCKTKELQSTHGKSGTQLYRTWTNMKARCDNPNAQYYADYGGRGITYCDEWNDFQAFYDWALANGYDSKLTLDRKDNNLGYCPSNCWFTDRKNQQANRRAVSGSSSKYVGVSYVPRNTNNPWVASIKNDGSNIIIGSFPTELEASHARDSYVKQNNLPNTLNH